MKQIIPDNIENLIPKVFAGDSIDSVLPLLDKYNSIYILYDRAVPAHPARITSLLNQHRPGVYKASYSISATEENKDISTVMDICTWLLEGGADRNALLLVIGGGLTTDLGGFAASIYKRGISFAYVPTTLLSMVDAGIGGKTGVNLKKYKNIVGTIVQPDFTYLCSEPLLTLPYDIFKSGLSEMFKTFIIEDDGQYGRAAALFSKINSSLNPMSSIKSKLNEIFPLVVDAAKVKIGVVSRDEHERGERRKLNLGHTFAHAIEKLSENKISHADAVSMGMVMAAKLSENMGLAKKGFTSELMGVLKSIGLPVTTVYKIDSMAQSMAMDKKADGKEIYFILPKSVGEVVERKLLIEEMVDIYK